MEGDALEMLLTEFPNAVKKASSFCLLNMRVGSVDQTQHPDNQRERLASLLIISIDPWEMF